MNWISAKYPVFKAAASVFIVSIIWIPIYLFAHSYSAERNQLLLSIGIPLLVVVATIDLTIKRHQYGVEISEYGGQIRVKDKVFLAEDIVRVELHLWRGQTELRCLLINGQEQRIILDSKLFGISREAVRAILMLAYRMELEEEEERQSRKSLLKEVHTLDRSQLIQILGLVLDALPSK
jgi:hypothetical protein